MLKSGQWNHDVVPINLEQKFKHDHSDTKVFKNRALFSKSHEGHSDFFQDYTERD